MGDDQTFHLFVVMAQKICCTRKWSTSIVVGCSSTPSHYELIGEKIDNIADENKINRK